MIAQSGKRILAFLLAPVAMICQNDKGSKI